MATERLPAYVNPRTSADGTRAYYWIRPAWANPENAKSPDEKKRRLAVRHGHVCPVDSTPLGSDLADAITKGNALNAAFKEWREGKSAKLVPGSVRWLFDWYRKQDRYLKNRHTTRTGYKTAMDMVEEMEMKVGKLGSRMASAVDGPVADKLYQKAKAKHGLRQGSYMMQVCRLVWNMAARPGYSKVTGVKHNPFAAMGIQASSGEGRGNRAATRAEYELYRATARSMGKQSMATAAALAFECCQRVFDVFGFEDPDERVIRGFYWPDYRPGGTISVTQSKTRKTITLPLVDGAGDEVVQLYPELEEELARTPRTAGADREMIVRDERTGQPYTKDYMTKLHRRIRDKAKLPADLRFTSFRHGGMTEVGDTGEADTRALSGHSKVDTTKIYDKANQEKARRIALLRREHIAAITAGEAENDA